MKNDVLSLNKLIDNVHQKTLIMRNIDTFVNSDVFRRVYPYLDEAEIRRYATNFNYTQLKNYCYVNRYKATGYENLSVRELRQIASKRKIKGYTGVGKGGLITLLKKYDRKLTN